MRAINRLNWVVSRFFGPLLLLLFVSSSWKLFLNFILFEQCNRRLCGTVFGYCAQASHWQGNKPQSPMQWNIAKVVCFVLQPNWAINLFTCVRIVEYRDLEGAHRTYYIYEWCRFVCSFRIPCAPIMQRRHCSAHKRHPSINGHSLLATSLFESSTQCRIHILYAHFKTNDEKSLATVISLLRHVFVFAFIKPERVKKHNKLYEIRLSMTAINYENIH